MPIFPSDIAALAIAAVILIMSPDNDFISFVHSCPVDEHRAPQLTWF